MISKLNNRLEKVMSDLMEKGEKALAVFLMAGDPDLRTSKEMIRAALEGGADIIEIGVPFSDPLADGPVIQKAAQRGLKNGTGIRDILKMSGELRLETDAPIILLTYYNIVFRFGLEIFFNEARQSGIDALVIPDLSFEEKTDINRIAESYNIILIDFLAPTTSEARGREILKDARGFIYCVSLTGVTGVRDSLSPVFKTLVYNARRYTKVPMLAGFGISTPEQAREAAEKTDGVIVGSFFVREVEKNMEDRSSLPGIIRDNVSVFKSALLEPE